MREQILKGLYTFPDEFWFGVSATAKDLIRQMMCVDSNKRLTIANVLEHPWLANDPVNTERVEKIIQPIVETMKNGKRSLESDDSAMDDISETPKTGDTTHTRNKRVKY